MKLLHEIMRENKEKFLSLLQDSEYNKLYQIFNDCCVLSFYYLESMFLYFDVIMTIKKYSKLLTQEQKESFKSFTENTKLFVRKTA